MRMLMKPVSIKSQWNAVPFSNLVQTFTDTSFKWFVDEKTAAALLFLIMSYNWMCLPIKLDTKIQQSHLDSCQINKNCCKWNLLQHNSGYSYCYWPANIKSVALTCVLVHVWGRWRCSGRWRWATQVENPDRPRSGCSSQTAFQMEGSWRLGHCGHWTLALIGIYNPYNTEEYKQEF